MVGLDLSSLSARLAVSMPSPPYQYKYISADGSNSLFSSVIPSLEQPESAPSAAWPDCYIRLFVCIQRIIYHDPKVYFVSLIPCYSILFWTPLR